MAMPIRSFSPAYAALRQTGQASGRVSAALERISTGQKINAARDNPAGLVISEMLRSQAGATAAALQNTREAGNLLSIAEGGLGSMQENLRQMRSLAVHALNTGINSPEQAGADQAVLDSLLQTMQRTAATTRYAGQNLLDGSRADPAADPKTAFQASPDGGGMALQRGSGGTAADRERINLPDASLSGLGRVADGGRAYALDDLRAGGGASLAANPLMALRVIDQAIADVAEARAGIGAYQANSLETGADNLEKELASLVSTESYLRDADIARESTELAQARTQMQVGLRVIARANQLSRQNALSLLEAGGVR